MFPSTRKQRRQTASAARAYQRESPPTKGGDSTYGVKSVSDWGGSPESSLYPEAYGDAADRASTIPHAYAYPDEEKAANDVRSEDEDEDGDDQGGDDDGGSTPEAPHSLAASGLGLGLALELEDVHVHAQRSYLHQAQIGTSSSAGHSHTPEHTHQSPVHHAHAHVRVEQIVPPSPEDTVHPLDRAMHPHHHHPHAPEHEHGHQDLPAGEDSGAGGRVGRELTLESLALRRTFDSPFLPTSEPSSPASFTSMPSYVASLSSLSRTSSISPLGAGDEHDMSHGADMGTGMGMGSIDELVLPTLSLPSESLSLHMSLPKWDGEEGGLGITLLGTREVVERTLRGLRDRCPMVEIRGGVGLVKEGKIVLRIGTGLNSVGQVHAKINHTYEILNSLIHPQLQEEEGSTNTELRRLVEGYAARSDWVHLVVHFGAQDLGQVEGIVPCTSIDLAPKHEPTHIDTVQEQDIEPQNENEQSPHSQTSEIEPTPRPCDDPSREYFAPRDYTPSPSSSSRDHSPSRRGDAEPETETGPESDVEDAIELLVRYYTNPSLALSRSIDSFLNWRSIHAQTETQYRAHGQGQGPVSIDRLPVVPSSSGPGRRGDRTMACSFTSASSAYGGAGLMPTVARAQGGGEWEATLSRRVAQRRESDHQRSRDLKERLGSGSGSGSGAGFASGSNLNVNLGTGTHGYPASRGGSGRGSLRARGDRRRRSFERERERVYGERPLSKKDKENRDCLPPLFPATPHPHPHAQKDSSRVGESGLGVRKLLGKTFGASPGAGVGGALRRWTKGWRGAVVVAAVVVAVGWGCWISKKGL